MAPEHLEDYYRVLTGSELDLPSTGRIFQPRARDLSRMRRLHAEACRLAENKPQLLGHTEVARAIEHDLIHALVNCLATENARGDTAALGATARSWAGLRTYWLNILIGHCTYPICTRLSVSEIER